MSADAQKRHRKKRVHTSRGSYIQKQDLPAEPAKKQGLAFLQILLLAFIIAYLASWALTLWLGYSIYTWTTLIMYVTITLVLLFHPFAVIELLAKRNPRLLTDLDRQFVLKRRVRAAGLVALALTAVLVYNAIHSVITANG
jgi:hypothetical protein